MAFSHEFLASLLAFSLNAAKRRGADGSMRYTQGTLVFVWPT